jgi:hypothetical protein
VTSVQWEDLSMKDRTETFMRWRSVGRILKTNPPPPSNPSSSQSLGNIHHSPTTPPHNPPLFLHLNHSLNKHCQPFIASSTEKFGTIRQESTHAYFKRENNLYNSLPSLLVLPPSLNYLLNCIWPKC